jgi:hypothetical protein
MTTFSTGLPGVRTARTATQRRVLVTSEGSAYAPQSAVVNGALSRDTGHTGDLDILRCGMLMGRITTGGKLAPAVLGVTIGNYTSGGTSITVSAAEAVEIVRRVGSSGNLRYVGPPAAAGTVAVISSIAFSAVNTTTGVITVTSLGVNLFAGSFVCATDGSHLPVCVQGDEYGIKVTDQDGVNEDQPLAAALVGGYLDSSQLLPWPADASLRTWVMDRLRDSGCFFGYDHPLVD